MHLNLYADRWVEAAKLKPGDLLRDDKGEAVVVTTTTHRTERATVHNLTVNDTHTYYVGAGSESVLVHNCGGAVGGHKTSCTCATGGKPVGPSNAQSGRRYTPQDRCSLRRTGIPRLLRMAGPERSRRVHYPDR